MSSRKNTDSPYPPQAGEIVASIDDSTIVSKAGQDKPNPDVALRALLENTNDGFILFDCRGNVLIFNHIAAELYRIHNNTVLAEGASIYDLVSEDRHGPTQAIFEDVMKGHTVERTVANSSPEGKKYYFKRYFKPVRSEDGTIYAVANTIADITSEIEDQFTIRRSEANLRALFDNAKEGFVLIDLSTTILAFNHAAAFLYSQVIGKELSIGKSVAEVLGPQLGEYMRAAFQKVIAGESFERKSQQYGINGKNYWLRGYYNPVRSANGTIIGICLGITDITGEMEAYAHMAELAAIVYSSGDAIIGKTLEGIVTSWNPEAERMFGYTPKEMIGESITKLIPADRLSEEQNILDRLKKGERIEHFETIRITKTGTPLNISLTVSPIRDSDGRIIGASKIAHNITEQKLLYDQLRANELMFVQKLEKEVADRTIELTQKNEEITQQKDFMETILDSSIDQICVYDKEMRFLAGNKTFMKEAGVNAGNIIGKTFLEVFPSLKDSPIYKGLQNAIAGKRSSLPWESPETGHRYTIFFTPPEKNNEIYGAMVTAHDNTEILKISERLLVTNNNLEEKNMALMRSNAELEQFAYIASHDLQEPLRKIRMFSGRMKENPGSLDETTLSYLGKIIKSTDRMSDLIKDILQYSRLTNVHSAFQRTDLNELIRNVLSEFDLTIEENRADIHVGSLPTIDGMPQQLSQLFHNLISNSLKFSRSGTPAHIVITSSLLSVDEVKKRKLNDSSRYWKITVKDSGIGFDQVFAEKIFVIFQRLNDRSEFEGTGIGLALCRKIATLHHGEIYAESKEGEGAEFHIILPEKQNKKGS